MTARQHVADVFGGLAGGPGDPSRDPIDLASLDVAFDGAAVWGCEIDTRYRVLAVTLEPVAERYPWAGRVDASVDRRVQLLCFPVSTILASLRQETPDGRALLEFREEQLVDVVAAMDGPVARAPLFRQPEPRPGSWGPRFSLEGRSSAPDGIGRTLTLRLRADELSLDLFARFDDLEVKAPDGTPLVG